MSTCKLRGSLRSFIRCSDVMVFAQPPQQDIVRYVLLRQRSAEACSCNASNRISFLPICLSLCHLTSRQECTHKFAVALTFSLQLFASPTLRVLAS